MNREQRRASKANGRRMMKHGWSGWEDWTQKAYYGILLTQKPDGLVKFWKNSMYTVQEFHKETDWGLVTHLMCRRNDESAVHSWSDLQRIKNELIGEDRTAVEVYPSSTKLVDQANMYHLWVLPEGFKLPFGLKP